METQGGTPTNEHRGGGSGTWACLPWGHGGAVLVQEACASNSSWLLLLLSMEQTE